MMRTQGVAEAPAAAVQDDLSRRLEEAEDTIRAIRDGAVDAFVVEENAKHRIYTLHSADRPYRLMVERMQQGAATLHADGSVAYGNGQAAVLLGLPLQQLVTASLVDFVSERDRPRFAELLAGARCRPVQAELQLRRADGSEFPAWLAFNALPGDSGASIGVLISDLTSQHHHAELADAHTALAHRVQQFETLLRRTPLGVFVVDADLRICEVNPVAVPVLGEIDGDVIGRPLDEILHIAWNRDYADEILRRFRHTLETGESFVSEADHGEQRGNRDSVEFYEWQLDRIPLPDGRFGVVCWFREVSTQVQARNRLAEQSRRMKEVAVASAAIHSSTTRDEVLTTVADEARRIIDAHQAVGSLTVDEQWSQSVMARSLSDKYAAWRHWNEEPDGSGIYALVCRSNRPVRLTQQELEQHPAYRRFGRFSREHPPLRGWLAAPLVARDGRNLGLVQLSDKVDGSEFNADDEAILQQLARVASVAIDNVQLYDGLREADRRKDEFLATLAHELRNPLAPIRNAVELLRMRMPRDPDLEWSHEVIERQIAHLTRLVDDLLDVSRISRNKLELRRGRIELASVIGGAVELSRTLIEQRGHELMVALPDDTILLDGDLVRLAQVFMNLLNNAAKYTPRGGRIKVAAIRDGDEVVVSIRDNGVGIPADQMPRLFEMFYQVDRSMERTYGGLGIGLALVRRLVELHDGRIHARSDGSGKGSEFVVHLPLARAAAASRAAEGDGSGAALCGRRRILVVDDNTDAADSLAMLLQLHGHEVEVAHDGVEAVATAARCQPDVVLLDLGLPRLNGYEVCRHLRRQPDGERMVVIAQTGWGQDEDRQQSKSAGFDAHLVKPLDYPALVRLLSSLTEGRRLQQARSEA